MAAGRKAKPGEIDWSALKQEYITGNVSYHKLAAAYGYTDRAVERVGRRERWVEQRREYREKLLKQTVDKVQAAESEQAAERLMVIRSAADQMAEVIGRVLNDTEQFYRYLVRQDGETVCETFEKADTKAIRDLTGSIRDLAGVLRDLYDLPTVQERQAMELAREKMDMARADSEGTTGSMVVEFEGAANDWAG